MITSETGRPNASKVMAQPDESGAAITFDC